jgi:uncharacterized protein (DUF2141 family)
MPIASHVLRASALALAVLATSSRGHASGNSITASILNLRSDQGNVSCSLYASEEGFPTKPEKAVARKVVRISSKQATCVFDDVAAGSYAISAMHDENGNGKLDENFLGMPTEGYGASRDARGSMGPARWKDAVFSFGGGAAAMPIPLHY